MLTSMWNLFEAYIELAILRITKMQPLHCAILLGSLQHKAKVSILKALLHEEGKGEAVSKIKAALSHAKRNALLHGVPGIGDSAAKFAFYHRQVDDRYVVQNHMFTAEQFHAHVTRFLDLVSEALFALGINPENPATELELDAYGKAARFAELD